MVFSRMSTREKFGIELHRVTEAPPPDGLSRLVAVCHIFTISAKRAVNVEWKRFILHQACSEEMLFSLFLDPLVEPAYGLEVRRLLRELLLWITEIDANCKTMLGGAI
jgi:hypothetical protein